MMSQEMYRKALLKGLLAGAQVVQRAVEHTSTTGQVPGVRKKIIGQSFTTDVDRKSEEMIVGAIGNLEGLRIYAREGARSGTAGYTCLVDPLNGTHDLLAGGGLNSTVGGGILDEDDLLCDAAIVSPIERLAVVTTADRGTELRRIFDMGSEGTVWSGTGRIRDLHVWKGARSKDSIVFLDRCQDFKCSLTQTLNDLEATFFLFGLKNYFTVRQGGSHLRHQMQVAAGWSNAAASVRFAKDGNHDFVGAIAVVCAGGVARGYNIVRTSVVEDEILVSASDFRNLGSYSIQITANNNETLELIEGLLRKALKCALDPKWKVLTETFRGL